MSGMTQTQKEADERRKSVVVTIGAFRYMRRFVKNVKERKRYRERRQEAAMNMLAS